MRAVVQRTKQAQVEVDGRIVGKIDTGLAVLLGIAQDDSTIDADYLADKIANLRIFSDPEGKMNLSLADARGAMLVVSQFTLYADCRKGRRPSFTNAARPEIASPLCEMFVEKLRAMDFKVETGEFQADMLVEIHNTGPVTIWLDTTDLPRSK